MKNSWLGLLLRMITRTFRLNPEHDLVLNDESTKHGLSVSNLLNQMIDRHVMVTRYAGGIPSITISYRLFEALLDCISDEDLVKIAKNIGSILPEEELLQRGKRLDRDNLFWFMKTIQSKYHNWFQFTNNFVGTEEMIHLSHQLSDKWSLYLRNYIDNVFTSVLNLSPRIETRTNSITVYFSKNKVQLK